MNTLPKTGGSIQKKSLLLQGHSPFPTFKELLHDKVFLSFVVLILAIFLSALVVVYVQAENRLLFSKLVSLQKERDALHVEWGQLLLEESTWATQSRIEKIAEEKLNMGLPRQKNIIIVHK